MIPCHDPISSRLTFISTFLLLAAALASASTPHPSAAAMAAATSSARIGGRLAGQRVLVTGAGRGIGRAIAHICNREGARVAIVSRTQSDLDETASLALRSAVEHGKACAADGTAATKDGPPEWHPVDTYIADVTIESDVEDMVQKVVEKLGGVDILVNNAGGSQAAKGPQHLLPPEDLRRLLDLNVVSVHMVTSAVLRCAMIPAKSGRVVNLSSRAGKVGLPNSSFYVASKFALEGFSDSLANEVKDMGIEVNTLSPGMVDTRSFPKPPGRPGVRAAESVEDGLFALLEGGRTGCYLHVDELDEARSKGLEDSTAIKPIREATFLS